MNDPRHDPGTIGILTYAWVLGLSLLGGFANFIGKHRRGEVRAFNVTELIGELVISAFAGIITFYLCTYAELDPLLTAALVGKCDVFVGDDDADKVNVFSVALIE